MGSNASSQTKRAGGHHRFGETWRLNEKAPLAGCIVFLHGLGDTGQNSASSLETVHLHNVRFVCPTAPTQPLSLHDGELVTAWFDLFDSPPSARMTDSENLWTKIDWNGVNESVNHVKRLIESEVAKGVPSEKLFVGGFSQGGTIALRAAMRCERKLGGVIMLSSFVGPADDLQPGKIPTANAKIPVFWGHGDKDPKVPIKLGMLGAESLKELGIPVEWKTYRGMGHNTCKAEFIDFKAFVEKVLDSTVSSPFTPSSSEVETMSKTACSSRLLARGKAYVGRFEKSEVVGIVSIMAAISVAMLAAMLAAIFLRISGV
uniref:Phospholipase/carboxylesterase/thioesterase domain-containing protein n=1 Tax=Pyramimonas obovata TaxID=1411642 RepID=A0A7S0WX56_9CHLO|mmetsp:Transcript_7952/g.16251  ORF Transcript_7952/g.16251 Transcript_7952/m.16251 type:complete len:317 (+) Transcript_7952:150-1100(+)|eukprot:CAMPEP_0118931134 /NCGR_PEP_ID=MMETSP1169-20130426/7579_1 /TAXON_ID=36882 /ORGANISM="Pyramimonas obovata, Strain CCMP722" /LENGTH=316 /DNA_ID=CAMNT_0006873597 /DNA_START=139 /DNA_END=1089 /DNA_ORIENTATION=+